MASPTKRALEVIIMATDDNVTWKQNDGENENHVTVTRMTN